MQVNVAGLRRNIKNLAHNYSDAQVKVREATSNDLWGPPSTLMAEIADLTYNMVAFSEIMQMIWKRLNDHGKNWRHVHKALVLLEYLIKTGSEKVAQQCKENIFAIQTLHEFQYIEEGKDQGLHVRDKAKALVALLRDDERLKNERVKALKAKERFAQHPSGFGSDGSIDGPTQRDQMHHAGWQEGADPRLAPSTNEIEFVRPLTVNEEELQLQLAMAMSREEAAQEDAKRRSDDVRLQLALSQSEQDFGTDGPPPPSQPPQQSHLLDLLDINLGATSITSPTDSTKDPWSTTSRAPPVIGWGKPNSPPDPWSLNRSSNDSPSITTSGSSAEGWLEGGASGGPKPNGILSDPWLGNGKSAQNNHLNQINNNNSNIVDQWYGSSSSAADPWTAPSVAPMGARPSPVGAITSPASEQLDEFDIITNRSKSSNINNNNVNLLDDMDPLKINNNNNKTSKTPLKTPHSFLGENSGLVNLDNLIKPVSASTSNTSASTSSQMGQPNNPYNPFGDLSGSNNSQRSFFPQQQPVPSINQLKQQPFTINQDPWAPVANTANAATTQNNNINWTNNNVEPRTTTLSPSNPFLS